MNHICRAILLILKLMFIIETKHVIFLVSILSINNNKISIDKRPRIPFVRPQTMNTVL